MARGRDLVIAGLACALLVLVTANIPPAEGERPLDLFGFVLLLVAGAALGVVRRRPPVAVGLITAVLVAYVSRQYAGGPVFAVGWVTLFFLSHRDGRRAGLLGAGVLCGLLSVATAVVAGDEPLLYLVFLGWSGAAVFLGDAVRVMAERREEEARRRLAEERLRIARDLHDSVAHAIATIAVQAGAAAHVLERRPEAAREALTTIHQVSAGLLDELASLVGVLREDGAAAGKAPTPDIHQVPALVASSANATLEIEGPLDAVPAPVGTAVYRIVQESLTNVVRHAGGAPARVAVRVGPDGRLTVEVTDEGCGHGTAGAPSSGVGIQGMRERAEATGGRLEAGPRPEEGFRVRAWWEARR